MWRFGRWLRDQEPDVVHVHGRSSFSFVALCRELRLLRRPVLVHDHAPAVTEFPRWYPRAARRHADVYVTVCQPVAEQIAGTGFPADRLHVVSNAIDLSRFTAARPSSSLRGELGIPEDKLVGLCVGRFDPLKGFDVLLKALSSCRGRDDIVMLMVGGTTDHDLRRRCDQLRSPLGDSVRFLGERHDVPSLSQEADFGVIPSRWESGPIVLIELMSAGLPFVATGVGDISETAARGGLEEFVPPDDPTALAAAIDRLVELPPAERERRGERGREFALEHFEIQTALSRWYGLYAAAAAA